LNGRRGAAADAMAVDAPAVEKKSPYFSTNEKVNLPICSEQTERTRHRK
jgi:hypothetical protein